jgi:hypothetical protein
MSTRSPIRFKTALDRLRAECSNTAAGPLDASDLNHLHRWASDNRAEAVWRKIQNLAWSPVGTYDPLDGFIISILVMRRIAESIPILFRAIDRDKRRSALFKERVRYSEELAKFWRWMAEIPRKEAKRFHTRAAFYDEEARMFRKLAAKPPRGLPFLVSRVDKNGSQRQRAFMQAVGHYLLGLCGRPLDGEVAILNDIAFDTQEATSLHQARSARRQTTRKSRKK